MPADLFAAVEAWTPVAALRTSLWTYPAVNAAHIAGIALLFGGIVPLDLRLLGLWRGVPAAMLARVLTPVAVTGLLLAVCAGALMFSVQATKYAAADLFRLKLVLIAAAVANAVLLRRTQAWRRILTEGSTTIPARLRVAAILSIGLWLSAIVAGRLIGYR